MRSFIYSMDEKSLSFLWIISFDLDIKPIKGILEKLDGSLVRKLSPGYNILTKLIKEVLNFETFKDKILPDRNSR